jgi:membrane-bound metal-dependent hydrolase YbcI (DUF457 family)
MLLEHLIYSTAIAILIYTLYRKKECLFIIIGSAYVSDIDMVADSILKKMSIVVLVYGQPIQHGDFHNILVMILYATLIALLLNTINIKMKDSFILANIGFGLHLLEDALVFNPGYRFFWPISDKIYGIGLMTNYNGRTDFYGIANTNVLIIGIILVILSLCIKYIFDNNIKTVVRTNGRRCI